VPFLTCKPGGVAPQWCAIGLDPPVHLLGHTAGTPRQAYNDIQTHAIIYGISAVSSANSQ